MTARSRCGRIMSRPIINEGMCRMLIGDFDRGWQKLEWGWIAARQRYVKRNFSQAAVARIE